MTYEEYKKNGLCLTKEAYVSKQKNDLKEKAKVKEKTRNIFIFSALAVPTFFALAQYIVYRDLLKVAEDFFIYFGIPLAISEPVYLFFAYIFNKKAKKIKSTKIELPTDPWMADYNLRQYHLSEAKKLDGKVLQKK